MFVAEINTINDPEHGTTALIGDDPNLAIIAQLVDGKWEAVLLLDTNTRIQYETVPRPQLQPKAVQALWTALAQFN